MEDVALPRGGLPRAPSSVKKPTLEKDDLFKARDSDLPKKRVRKRRKKEAEGEEEERSSVAVEALTIRLLAEGMVVLGRVQQVQEFGLRVSLPGAITGRVPLTKVSHPYSLLLRHFAQGVQEDSTEILPLTRMFQEGQAVVCKVLSAAPVEWGSSKVSVSLSTDPADVNGSLTPLALQKGMVLQAAVSSVEDHGYTMDCGIEGVSAFLSRAEAAAFIKKSNAGHALAVGQLLQCAVLTETRGGRALQLTARPSTVNTPVELEDFSLDHVLPGFRAEVTVMEAQEEGLVVQWQGMEACVHRAHLPGPWDRPEDVAVGETLACTLLYVQPLVQRPYLSAQGSLGRAPFGAIRPGVLLDAQVVAVEHGAVHLRLEPGGIRALCPRPLVADQDVEDARDFVNAGEQLRCRVMALSYMDRVVVVSLKKSMLSDKFVTSDALVPGAKFDCTVRQVYPSGILVSLSPWVAGFVQALHVSDHEGEKPGPGTSLRARLLHVDRSSDPPRLQLTCRRALITSRRPIIASYDDATPGKITDGLVVRVTPKGLLVALYNNIKGWVPPRELPPSGRGVEAGYTAGKVVTCRVVDCQPSEERLTLSLKLTPKGEEEAEALIQAAATSLKREGVEVGKLVSGIIEARVEDGFTVRLRNGAHASLPRRHLSDSGPHCARLQQLLREGTNLTNLVVFHASDQIVVSRKALLVSAAQQGLLVSSFENLEPGTLVFGLLVAFVRHGMLLELPAGIRGFVPIKDVADGFLSDASRSGFALGQCLLARVTQVDTEKCQVWLSTSMKSVAERNDRRTMECLAAQLSDEELLSGLGQREVPSVASLVKVTIQDVDLQGKAVYCKIAGSELSAVAEVVQGKKLESGNTLEAVVLYSNSEDSTIELCLDPQVVRSVRTAKKAKPSLRCVQSGRVLLTKDDHAVALLHSGHLCLVPTKSHPNATFLLPLEKGTTVSIWAWKVCRNVIIGAMRTNFNDFVKRTPLIAAHVSGVEPAPKLRGAPTEPNKFEKAQAMEADAKDDSGVEADDHTDGSGAEAPVDDDDSVDAIEPAVDKQMESTSAEPKKTANQELPNNTELNLRPVMAVVKAVEKLQLKLILENGSKGRLHISLVERNPKEGKNPLMWFKPGDELEVYVLDRRIAMHRHALAITGRKNFCECSLFPTQLNSFAPAPGSHVIGFFSHVSEGTLVFTLGPSQTGKLPVLNMDLPPSRLGYVHTEFKVGQAVAAKVLKADESSMVELSQLDVTTLAVDTVVNGCLVSTRPGVGACVCLPLGHRGTISVTDVCDDFDRTKSLLESYMLERYVHCYILDFDNDAGTYCLSTRESRLCPNSAAEVRDKEVMALSSLTVGATYRGFVRAVNKHGCFVAVGCGVDGLIPLSKLPVALQRNQKALKPGEVVSVVVRRIQASQRRLLLGLVDHEPQEAAAAVAPPPSRKRQLSTSSTDEPVFDSSGKKPRLELLPRLSLSEGFDWDVLATPDLGSLVDERPTVGSSEDEDEDERSTRKSRKEILQEREQAEAELRKKERLLVDPSREPETVDDFDRLVLTSPNSSMVWLRYMAFHLRQAEIEKARAVARRALMSIQFREEQEKLNVWMALLNLEHLYGTQESLDGVFQEALQFNDPLKVYTHLAQIYMTGNKQEQAEQLYKQMLNKFKQNVNVWLGFGLFYMKFGDVEACRALLQRALKSLPSQEHVAVISKFAQMEFKYGDAERGRSMFNSILDNYPKRTDLWLVYVDMLTKHGDLDNARKTFEKVTSLNLNPKKMKAVFKKWLDFEKQHGDTASLQAVKQRAVQYVEQRTSVMH